MVPEGHIGKHGQHLEVVGQHDGGVEPGVVLKFLHIKLHRCLFHATHGQHVLVSRTGKFRLVLPQMEGTVEQEFTEREYGREADAPVERLGHLFHALTIVGELNDTRVGSIGRQIIGLIVG